MDDSTWPLAGRVLGGGSLEQGAHEEVKAMWQGHFSCDAAAEPLVLGDYACETWQGCSEPLDFCYFDGGHQMPEDWIQNLMTWYEAL